jgi:hypothetical protein
LSDVRILGLKRKILSSSNPMNPNSDKKSESLIESEKLKSRPKIVNPEL